MAITPLGSTRIEPSADVRDTMGLGHCNFQFYDNAAGHYFSPAALLVCRRSLGVSVGAGGQPGLPLEFISTRHEPFGAMFANGCPWRAGYCHAA
jgi:hypothetical protein